MLADYSSALILFGWLVCFFVGLFCLFILNIQTQGPCPPFIFTPQSLANNKGEKRLPPQQSKQSPKQKTNKNPSTGLEMTLHSQGLKSDEDEKCTCSNLSLKMGRVERQHKSLIQLC